MSSSGGSCNSFSSAAFLTCTISASATAAASVIATNDQPFSAVSNLTPLASRILYVTFALASPAHESTVPRPATHLSGMFVRASHMAHTTPWRSAFDLRVFVDADDDVRALRRLRRDIRERDRTIESVCAQWLATVRPMHKRYVAPARHLADLVVSGEDPIERSMRSVLEQLKKVEARPRPDSASSTLLGEFGA